MSEESDTRYQPAEKKKKVDSDAGCSKQVAEAFSGQVYQDDEQIDRKSEVGSLKEIETGRKGCRIFVKGISKHVSDHNIQLECEKFGAVFEAYNTGKGYAFVSFQFKNAALNAIKEMNREKLFGEQVNIETARTGLQDMPPEIISIIAECLPFADSKTFREVCLMSPLLRPLYTDDLQDRGILRWRSNLQAEIDWTRFMEDCNFLIKSTMEMSIEFPSKHELSQFHGLKSEIIRLVNVCHPKISEFKVFDDEFLIDEEAHFYSYMPFLSFGSAMSTLRTLQTLEVLDLNDLHQKVLPKLRQLKKLWLFSKTTERLSELYQNLLNNNKELENLALHEVKLTTRTHCSNLIKLDVVACRGAVSYLIQNSTATLTNLDIRRTKLDSTITEPLTRLQKLTLIYCEGDISSLISAAASSVTKMILYLIPPDTRVNNPFTNLKELVIAEVNVDESDSIILDGGDWQQVDITDHPLLSRGGTLAEFLPINGYYYPIDDGDDDIESEEEEESDEDDESGEEEESDEDDENIEAEELDDEGEEEEVDDNQEIDGVDEMNNI